VLRLASNLQNTVLFKVSDVSVQPRRWPEKFTRLSVGGQSDRKRNYAILA
jgi:hypothetical protein